MASETPRSKPQTYRSDWTDAQLWEMVRETALKVCPNRPEILSTRKFDDSRETMGWPDAPRARWLAERLKHSWPDLVKKAVDLKRDVTMISSAARRAPAEKWLDLRHLHFAINYVAKERGEETFSAYDYDETCAQLIEARQHSSKENTLARILPSSGQLMQIVRRLDATEKAKAEAEQPTKSKKSKSGAKKKTREVLPELEVDTEALADEKKLGLWNRVLHLAGKPPYEQERQNGVSVAHAIHLYIEATGLLPPSEQALKRFAQEANFSMQSVHKDPAFVAGQALKPFFAAAAELRNKLGLPMTDVFAGSRRNKPVFDLSKLPTDLPPPVRPRGYWDDEKIVEALLAYLESMKERNVRQATQDDYRKEQKKHRSEWPAPATLNREGEKSFTKWIERAQKELRKRKKQAA